jgi:hypothetical protein
MHCFSWLRVTHSLVAGRSPPEKNLLRALLERPPGACPGPLSGRLPRCTLTPHRAPQVATNITGHSGYELPLWLHAAVTAGVGLTPLAATSKTHYIHHLDPRFNKALYFTWCDRLAGSHRGTHRLIDGDADAPKAV